MGIVLEERQAGVRGESFAGTTKLEFHGESGAGTTSWSFMETVKLDFIWNDKLEFYGDSEFGTTSWNFLERVILERCGAWSLRRR
ncbi:hypothetical protein J6590_066312 [Homalodisca vitripennis]|nr:hypothetical protein J6590_066312 [Homalodisca vitripennis]